jgi:hypothetical protein
VLTSQPWLFYFTKIRYVLFNWRCIVYITTRTSTPQVPAAELETRIGLRQPPRTLSRSASTIRAEAISSASRHDKPGGDALGLGLLKNTQYRFDKADETRCPRDEGNQT